MRILSFRTTDVRQSQRENLGGYLSTFVGKGFNTDYVYLVLLHVLIKKIYPWNLTSIKYSYDSKGIIILAMRLMAGCRINLKIMSNQLPTFSFHFIIERRIVGKLFTNICWTMINDFILFFFFF